MEITVSADRKIDIPLDPDKLGKQALELLPKPFREGQFAGEFTPEPEPTASGTVRLYPEDSPTLEAAPCVMVVSPRVDEATGEIAPGTIKLIYTDFGFVVMAEYRVPDQDRPIVEPTEITIKNTHGRKRRNFDVPVDLLSLGLSVPKKTPSGDPEIVEKFPGYFLPLGLLNKDLFPIPFQIETMDFETMLFTGNESLNGASGPAVTGPRLPREFRDSIGLSVEFKYQNDPVYRFGIPFVTPSGIFMSPRVSSRKLLIPARLEKPISAA